MLKRNKAFSIVMTLCLCLALLAPVFVAPDAAQASCTYKILSAPTVTTGNVVKDLGAIKVTMDDLAVAAYSTVTVSLPSAFTFAANAGTVGVYATTAAAAGNGIAIVAPGAADPDAMVPADFSGPYTINANKSFDIKLNSPLTTTGADKYFYIYFNGINLNNFNGDVKVTMYPPSGSAFTQALDLVIGKTTSTGSTYTTCKKAVDLTDAGGALDIITVNEQSPGTFTGTDNIKLEILTNGFKFNTAALTDVASYGWDFGGNAVVPGNLDALLPAMFTSNDQLLTYPVLPGVAAVPTAGRISFANLTLVVDDSKVAAGDKVEIKVSGTNVTSQTIEVATYVDYGVTVEEGTTKDLIAGQEKQTIGEFFIKEGAAASLVNNRIVSFTLPIGCEWDVVNTGAAENTTSGSVAFNAAAGYPSLDAATSRVLKWQVTTPSTSAAKVKFKDFKIDVAPNFSGPVEIEIKGSAGAEGKIKVAQVVPAATIAVEDVVNIELGKANQKIDDIVITEGAVKALLDNTNPGNVVTLQLDDGYRFAKTPKVEVVEGDIDIDVESIVINGRTVTFDIDGSSAKTASVIKLSDVYIDAYRTAPEGPISLKFVEAAANALNECAQFATKSAGKYVVANCVTPSMTEGTEGAALGQFAINSNIYEVNGVKKVMDVAPYIKGGRTYVPVRYLGYALGVAEADVVWDEATQKVTLSQGDNVVELTIGSTTITVNGETKTMDVAPEIANDRTMLPARYVAEGLGYVVGWDPGTQTVLISK